MFDVGSLPGDVLALRQRIGRGEVTGPRLLTVDMPFYPDHGTPIYVRDLWEQYKVPSAEIATPAQGRERAPSGSWMPAPMASSCSVARSWAARKA